MILYSDSILHGFVKNLSIKICNYCRRIHQAVYSIYCPKMFDKKRAVVEHKRLEHICHHKYAENVEQIFYFSNIRMLMRIYSAYSPILLRKCCLDLILQFFLEYYLFYNWAKNYISEHSYEGSGHFI